MAITSQSAASKTQTDVSSISPYFLDPNENPSLVMVQPSLNGSNYHMWSRVMQLALVSKNKFGFVDGSILVPDRDDAEEEFQMWEQCNSMVLSWLLNSISSSIAQSVMRLNTAREVWNDLYERFSRGDNFRLYDILEELDSIKQGDLSVSDYYSKLKSLWGESLTIRPLPECSCGASRVYKEYFDTECVIRFLNGLNDIFAPIKSQILLSTPLPPVNKVFGMAFGYERHLAYSLGHPDKVGVSVQAAKGFSSTHQHQNQSNGFKNNCYENRTSVQCTFCGILGHTEDKCYRKHGFPQGVRGRGRGSSGRGGFRGSGISANRVELPEYMEDSPVVGPKVTNEQINQLMNLLKSTQSSHGAVR